MLSKLKSYTIGFHSGIPVEQLKQQYVTPESQFFTIEGMDVHYRVTGQGPALLLIHGIGSSLHTWSHYHHLLSDNFRVISLDIPGFGLTGPHPKNNYSFEMYAKVFSGLLNHIGVDKVHIAGNSLGGILTWQYAILAPQKVIKIVLLNSVGFNTKFSDLTDIGFILAAHPYTKRITYKLLPKSLVKTALKNSIYDASIITKEKVNLYYDLLMRKGNRESFSRILTSIIVTEEDNTPLIKSINIITLIIWGEEDTIINVGDAYQFHQAIAHSELIIYPKVGHLPMEELPEKSAQDIKDFLLK